MLIKEDYYKFFIFRVDKKIKHMCNLFIYKNLIKKLLFCNISANIILFTFYLYSGRATSIINTFDLHLFANKSLNKNIKTSLVF